MPSTLFRSCSGPAAIGCLTLFVCLGCKSIDYNRIAHSSLVVAKNGDEVSRVFAWNALTASLRESASKGPSLDTQLTAEIENAARAAHTREALQTLSEIYSTDDSRRRIVLSDALQNLAWSNSSDSLGPVAAAILAKPVSRPNANWFQKLWGGGSRIEPFQTNDIQLISLLLTGSRDVPKEKAILKLSQLASPDGLNQSLATLLISMHPDLLGLSSTLVTEHLAECSARSDGQTALFLANACTEAYLNIAKTLSTTKIGSVSDSRRRLDQGVSELLASSAFADTNNAQPSDREIQITVLPSTLTFGSQTMTSDRFRYPNANGRADTILGGIRHDVACIAGGQDLGTHGSSCFQPYYSQATDPSLPGLAIHALGIQQYSFVSRGGTASLHFRVKLGYQPSPDGGWLAIRWRGWKKNPASDGIQCVSGCAKNTAITIEPETQWGLFSPLPSQLAVFQIDFDPMVDMAGPNSFGLPYTEYFEIFDINLLAVPRFVTFLPLEITKQVDHNPVLSYVAALQGSFSPDGWLAPRDVDLSSAASLAEGRFGLLSQLATMSDADLDKVLSPGLQNESSDEYARCQWKLRRNFLVLALPTVQAKITATFMSPLTNQLQLQAKYVSQVIAARQQLTNALGSLDKLESGQGATLLNQASTVLKLNYVQSPAGLTHDDLTSEVFGAQEAVAALHRDLVDSIDMGCIALNQMQNAPALQVCSGQ
jgi:hypothetical protein